MDAVLALVETGFLLGPAVFLPLLNVDRCIRHTISELSAFLNIGS